MKQKCVALRKQKKVKILAIESSCDETSVAIVENGRKVLSNIISSQIDIHRHFGGVVPEVASRNHILNIIPLVDQALSSAKCTLNDIDAIGVTQGAGLVGALLVGLTTAKALSFALDLPLINVNHIQGHIAANYIAFPTLVPPFMCLLTSGGHTAIIKVDDYVHFKLIGTTQDDAIGEAFDKVARVLGLEYPGGAKIDKLATGVEPKIKFIQHDIMSGSYDISYSGLKTAVINYVHKLEQNKEKLDVPQICASFQAEAVDMLVSKVLRACEDFGEKKLVLAGGVAANSYLRASLDKLSKKAGIELFYPPKEFCTDNAAMIGSIAYYQLLSSDPADLSISALANIPL
ncbi:MAG: tRNA (adenosine(37)-N6)-threonylcarbamoyltransferase complex transferase subunit TsaD [Clostridia bacterium]|nr:tRNA (adenosine(37)-N6)-threonylcarbamoyltransferase complex transferase subunit TsaD [Clostridia bacterium]